MNIHRACLTLKFIAPNRCKQPLAGNRHILVLQKEHEHIEFLRGQRDLAASFLHRVLFEIHRDIAVFQNGCITVKAPQHHLNAGKQLQRLKRLYDIILRAQAQPLHLVADILLCR